MEHVYFIHQENYDRRRSSVRITFSQEFLTDILVQMTSAIEHLHSNGIYHCDIKPENIMYNKLVD